MNDPPFRSFGIVPAAGVARRMGVQKLLLPFGSSTLIEHVLAQWRASRVNHTLVVLNRDDAAMIEICRSVEGVICVIPKVRPVEMKHSVQVALRWIQAQFSPRPGDAWLLAPADLPRIAAAAIDRVLDAYDGAYPAIVVPRHGQRRGHPALFSWSLADDVHRLPGHQGVNRLLDRYPVVPIDVDSPAEFEDIDTPRDYRRSVQEES